MELRLGTGWPSDKKTLGEISLGDFNCHLPAITLQHKDDNWEKNIFPSWIGHLSLPLLDGFDKSIDIPKKHHDKFIPIVKETGVPVVKVIPIKIPHIVPQTLVQPYPVLVPVTKPVPYEVVKYVIKHVVKKVPTAVEKIIPVPVEKLVPFEVERHQAVIKKVPFKIPIHKTIVHHPKH
ncbi:hypothetical protein PV325_007116 [Microctonus aethiopoides]|uniref:Uncharacterized protein n=1 Tax=Microctonus aethiopoides TaxID=144406 RepID=A0AA39F0Y4_9HYME|nr:hypothetical protein PV325_007116 [Microctonus aethiopoides]KAK0158683.1 hypothetical protein PV328_009659 [Microctonus aethiopoides]